MQAHATTRESWCCMNRMHEWHAATVCAHVRVCAGEQHTQPMPVPMNVCKLNAQCSQSSMLCRGSLFSAHGKHKKRADPCVCSRMEVCGGRSTGQMKDAANGCMCQLLTHLILLLILPVLNGKRQVVALLAGAQKAVHPLACGRMPSQRHLLSSSSAYSHTVCMY